MWTRNDCDDNSFIRFVTDIDHFRHFYLYLLIYFLRYCTVYSFLMVSGRSRVSRGGGRCQPNIWPIFPEKYMKIKKFGPDGGSHFPCTT